ncbi:MAG TPA: class I SAM-dependent methyltransferase [Dehalococcoidia bacterium]|jgi:SAM-dependent methyltransferase
MTTDRETLARTFDRTADLYDEARPQYPEALFDDLARVSGGDAGARVLELGCGTGKASVALARRGYRLTCIEPGPNLAQVARRNLAAFDAKIITSSFEEWPLEPGAFDIVAAATSWEWMDPALKFAKAAAALRPGGCVAIFSNAQVESQDPDGFWVRCQEVYGRHAPHMLDPKWRTMADLPRSIDQRFVGVGLEEAGVFVYPWVEAYDTDRYIKVLQTFSNHIALAEDVRAALLRDMATLIDQSFGGVVEKHWFSTLELARKP